VIGAALGGMARASVAGSTLSFGVVAMATTGLIGYAALGIAPRTLAVLRNPVLRFFGDISYWVYLFHYLAIDLIRRLVPTWGSDWAGYLKVTIIALSASIITGIAVRRWIELPVLSLKSRFR
jgi:peptidoglycan/LPS O-acetylase OafA/YrhL